MWAIVFGPAAATNYKGLRFNLQTARYVAAHFTSLRPVYSTQEQALIEALAILDLPTARQNNVKAFIVKVTDNG